VGDCTVGRVLHTAQQRAARDAGRGDEDVLARDEVVRGEHLVDVVAGVGELLPLLLGTRPATALQLATETLDRSGGDDALRRAPDTHQEAHPRPAPPARNCRRAVAAPAQLPLRARLPELPDQIVVPVAL